MVRNLDTPWMRAVRKSLGELFENDATWVDKELLKKAGLYREKLSLYRNGHNLPHCVNLVVALIVLKIPLRVVDPETGKVWVLTFDAIDPQMNLPLPGEPL